MSLSAKNTTPITADGLFNEIKLKHLDPSTLTGIGVNKDGTLVRIAEFPKKKVNKLQPPVEHFYTITDVPSAAGSFTISNTAFTTFTSHRAGVLTGVQTITFTKDGLIKTATVATDGSVGNRSINIDGKAQWSSKLIAPSTGQADLLDREIAVEAGKVVKIQNGAAGDQWTITWIENAL